MFGVRFLITCVAGKFIMLFFFCNDIASNERWDNIPQYYTLTIEGRAVSVL